MTLVGPGSWEAIRAAADCARTAAGLVTAGAPSCLRAVPSARPPRRTRRIRRLVLPEQRSGRRAGPAPGGRRPGRGARHRRPSRQRHAGDLLRAAGRLLRQRARRPGRWLVPALHGYADGARAGAQARAPTATCRSRPGAATMRWLSAVERLCTTSARVGRMRSSLSLGVDAAAADPESPLRGQRRRLPGRRRAVGAARPGRRDPGRRLRPALLGEYVLAALAGLQAGRHRAARDRAARPCRVGAVGHV